MLCLDSCTNSSAQTTCRKMRITCERRSSTFSLDIKLTYVTGRIGGSLLCPEEFLCTGVKTSALLFLCKDKHQKVQRFWKFVVKIHFILKLCLMSSGSLDVKQDSPFSVFCSGRCRKTRSWVHQEALFLHPPPKINRR